MVGKNLRNFCNFANSSLSVEFENGVMIYYFSGTGNSRAVAETLGVSLQEKVSFIPLTNPMQETMEGSTVGFVFPVYSWGVPPLVNDFIDRLAETVWEELTQKHIPVWVVMTCGDEVALAPEMVTDALRRHGVEPQSVWSVIMPNDYVLLPGFDVDPKDVENEKLKAAPRRIEEIAAGIKEGRRTLDVTRGSMAWLKSRLVYPLFKRWGVFPGKWHASDACIGCGICVNRCPLENIALDGKRHPQWGTDCCSCLACYHSCPEHAVQYGKATQRKGQYYHP